MNRQQRRKAKKQLPKHARLTKEQQIARLHKNGITVQDLEKNYNIGYEEGIRMGIQRTFRSCYAAFILAMRKQHRFGRRRCKRILKLADWEVVNALTTDELIDEVFNQIGLHIDFDDPFDRIKEATE
jgi:hypothetical protein